jgi:hypothetical protein
VRWSALPGFAGLVPYDIAIVCRRLYGRYLAKHSKHLDERIDEINSGKFDAELDALKCEAIDELKRKYETRDIEPAY